MEKNSNSKKLLIGTGIYAVGTFGTKILMFLIAPLYTYYLVTAEMGTYDVLISTIGLLIPVISLQISDAVYRWIIRDDIDSAAYLRITYQFLLFSSVIAAGIILIVNCIIPIPYAYFFFAALFSALIFQTNQKILRGLKKQWLFVISGIVYTCVFLAFNIIQLCVLHKGVESLFVSYIVANMVGFLTIVIFEKQTRMNLFKKPDIPKLKELLRFSVPLIPNYLSWWVIDSSDRYIVLFALGVSSNGVLAIAHKFPTILQSVFGLFLNSWQDMAIATDQDEKEFFTSVFKKLYKFSFLMLFALIPVTKLFVMLVMNTDYKMACDYIPFYYLGAVFQSFCSFWGVGYLRSKNTKGSFTSSVYAALINAAVNIAVIRFVGLHAAAISTFVAFFIMWLIRVKHNKMNLGITIEWKLFIPLLIADIAVCILSILFGVYVNCILSVVGILLFVFLCKNDVLLLLKMLKKRKS